MTWQLINSNNSYSYKFETSAHGKKKKTLLIDILVVTVTQPQRKFCYNYGEVCRMKLFILFLEKKVHLTVKVAGKVDPKMSFLCSFFFLIWLHGLISRELFNPDT